MIEKIKKFNKLSKIIDISIVVFFATSVFTLCSYLYEQGENLYFRIDSRFLSVNLENNRMIVLAYLFMTIFLFVSSYWIYKKNLDEKSKIKKVFCVALGMFSNALLLDILFNNKSIEHFIVGFIMYLLFAYFGIKIIGEKLYKIIYENSIEDKKNANKIIVFFIGVPIVFFILGLGDAWSQRNFDYITIDNQQYVVVDIYNDLYYTYPCEIDGGKMIADSSIRRMFAMNEVITKKGNFTLDVK